MRKKFILLAFGVLFLVSCAPVLSREYMKEGERRVSFEALRENTGAYKGRLYIMGGVIIDARFVSAGSEIEAMHVPVDRYGYFEYRGESEGRFLAMLPKEGKMLDPIVYREGRRVTLAGEFIGTEKGTIDEMEYVYPVFKIRQIYLWPAEVYYAYPSYYYDPWFYPFPYYYGHPWWLYPYRYYPRPVRPPVMRRAPGQTSPSSPGPTPFRRERRPE